MKSHAKSELPEDIKVESLTESQWRDLKHREEKERGELREARQVKEGKTEDLETRPVQPSFF